MDTLPALKQLEGRLAVAGDRAATLKSKLEDLTFRAQRIASAVKNNLPNHDTMYGYDLQHFRRDVRAYGLELTALPPALSSLERTAAPDQDAPRFAASVMRQCTRVAQLLKGLQDLALLAHQHIRAADHKTEAWMMAKEVEELAQKAQGLPAAANKIVILVSPADAGSPPA